MVKLPSCHALKENEAFAWSTHKVASVLRDKRLKLADLSQDTPQVTEHTGEKERKEQVAGEWDRKGRGWRRESDGQDGETRLAGLCAQLLPGGRLLRLRLWAGIGSAIESRHGAALGVGVQAAVWWVAGLQLCDPLGLLQSTDCRSQETHTHTLNEVFGFSLWTQQSYFNKGSFRNVTQKHFILLTPQFWSTANFLPTSYTSTHQRTSTQYWLADEERKEHHKTNLFLLNPWPEALSGFKLLISVSATLPPAAGRSSSMQPHSPVCETRTHAVLREELAAFIIQKFL